MILVDSSIWIDHLRAGSRALADLLETGEAASHPFVVGELACGTMRRRTEVLALLDRLPMLPVLGDREVRDFIEARRLMGRGLGWVDMHLLASAVDAGATVLTLDRPLAEAATVLGVA